MAISSKGRRKIVVDGTRYLWWVVDADDLTAGSAVHVVSEDGRLHVIYGLRQVNLETPLIISMGDDFGALSGIRGPYLRFATPRWNDAGAITPRFVHNLIVWCRSLEASNRRVDWRGATILASEQER